MLDLNDLKVWVEKYFTTERWRGNEADILCPLHKERHASCGINIAKRTYHCFACGRGGTLTELVKELNIEIPRLSGDGSGDSGKRVKPAHERTIPEEALQKLHELVRDDYSKNRWGEFVKGWRWLSADGSIECITVRYEREENDEKKKQVIPYYYSEAGKWEAGQPLEYGRCLYRLPDLLKSTMPVLVVEGEKKAEISVTDFFVTTWRGGAYAVKYTDWNPLIGREVTIWPDADEPGLEAALKIREYLPQARILDIQGRLKGWDLADAVAEGINPMEFIANCPVLPALEADSDNPAAEEQTEKHSKQADRAIRLGEECELFHCADAGFARLLIDKHYEVWPLRGKQFRNWLQQQFYSTTGSVLYNQALDDALGALEGKAKFKSQEWPVHVRLAGNDTCIYLDLGDPEWQIVEITAEGWQIVKEAQVRFRRPPGMEALPIPVSGGKLDTHLGPFLNMADEDRKLFISCLVAALRPTGPYPILNLQGEQGSAKSSAAWVFRQCIDPNTAPLRSTPREEQDMIIAAKNGWVIAYDNLSHLSGWVSDALCRLSTGSGYSTRELYTNYEEVIFQAQRPIILNGIEDLATRGDLLDRSVILNLPPVEEHKRMTEKYFQDQFRQEQPLILGALLDAVAAGIRNLPETNLDNPPRMADFATWVTACEKAIGWEPGTFLQVYRMNRADANSLALDANPIVPELIKLLAAGSWLGTATDLHEALNKQVSENKYKSRAWPKSGRAISASLKRLAPNLRAVGIEVEWDREPGIARTRVLRLKVKSNVLSSFCVLKPLLRPKIEDTKDAKDERTQDFTFYQKFPSATGGQGLSQNKPGNAILTTNIHQAVGASGSVGSFQLIISQSELMRGSLGG